MNVLKFGYARVPLYNLIVEIDYGEIDERDFAAD